jgi:hypothetical protein
MKIGGGMASKYFFEERWNNIESKGESEIKNTYVWHKRFGWIYRENVT